MSGASSSEAEAAGCQLYLIGPSELDAARFAPELEAALAAGGAVAFLLRLAQEVGRGGA